MCPGRGFFVLWSGSPGACTVHPTRVLISTLARTKGYSAAPSRQVQSANPKNVAASSTGLRCDTTALAGKLSSGQPMATQV